MKVGISVAMEAPASLGPEDVRDEKVKVDLLDVSLDRAERVNIERQLRRWISLCLDACANDNSNYFLSCGSCLCLHACTYDLLIVMIS